MTLRPRSIRLRLALWFGAALAIIVLVFSISVYLFVQARLVKQLNKQLQRDYASVKSVIEELPAALPEIDDGIPLAWVASDGGEVHATEDWRRAKLDRALQKTRGATILPKTAPTADRDKDDEEEDGHSMPPFLWTSNGRSYRIQTGVVLAKNETYQIAVAQDEKPVRQSLRTLALMLLIGFPCAVCLATVGGWFLAGRLLGPVGRMAAKAREISAERLSERLPVGNPEDEFGRLATVFNDTLSRLENSFEQLRRFTADASHELRTPLTAIRSVGEVALQESLDAAGCRDVIGSMLEETDRLARLVDNLLVLTRADSGRAALAREPLDLAALVRDVVECLSVLAEEKQAALSAAIEAEPAVAADRATLRQAIVNLLDNAIKFTPARGQVRVRVGRRDADAIIEFTDTGPGIAPEHRTKIFERFYRVEDARTRETGGAGLGLAIARWAVAANGGRIELESEEGRGSIFRIVLPERRGGEIA